MYGTRSISDLNADRSLWSAHVDQCVPPRAADLTCDLNAGLRARRLRPADPLRDRNVATGPPHLRAMRVRTAACEDTQRAATNRRTIRKQICISYSTEKHTPPDRRPDRA